MLVVSFRRALVSSLKQTAAKMLQAGGEKEEGGCQLDGQRGGGGQVAQPGEATGELEGKPAQAGGVPGPQGLCPLQKPPQLC